MFSNLKDVENRGQFVFLLELGDAELKEPNKPRTFAIKSELLVGDVEIKEGDEWSIYYPVLSSSFGKIDCKVAVKFGNLDQAFVVKSTE